jgi:hypothetical protein
VLCYGQGYAVVIGYRRRLSEGQKLRVGALAEDFTLADSARVSRTLSAMLSDGPLLIIFYRGYW